MSINRRQFLDQTGKTASAVAAATTVLSSARPAKAAPSDKVNIAVIGVRGRGANLAVDFASRPDCDVAVLCDVDASLLESRIKSVEGVQGRAPRGEQDYRRVLEDKSIDAVVVATPDHWHAPLTVFACQAGKDVYVEKPVSHSPWEGRKMVEAARRYNRVVQVGTQNRSAPYNFAAKEYIDQGKLGKIHLVRVYNQKAWGNATAGPDSDPPAGLDWDLWLGPTEKRPYNPIYRNGWHHFWTFSGGDIINDGVHQMDLARWLIGKDYPKSVYSTGGRFNQEGSFETPDTQVAVYDFGDLVMTFELTLYTPYMLKIDPVVRNTDMYPYWMQCATRIEIYGDKGLMIVGRHGGGWQVFDRPKSRQPVVKAEAFGRFPDDVHKQNFMECIKSRELPNADIEQGHRSTLLCQLANISLRLGGEKLVLDPKTETCQDSPQANALLKRQYRAPFVIPDQV